jgi:hypothetical protein
MKTNINIIHACMIIHYLYSELVEAVVARGSGVAGYTAPEGSFPMSPFMYT